MRNLTLAVGFGDVIDVLTPPITVGGLAVYVVIGIAIGALVSRSWRWYRSDDEVVEFADILDEATREAGADERAVLEDVGELQQSVVAPESIKWETRAARVGEQWTATLYVAGYPDYPSDGYLSELFELTDVEFDVTGHIEPRHQERARSELQDIADDLQVDADLEQSVRSAYLQERANEAAATYKAVEDGTSVFDQGLFVTVRADSRRALEESVQAVKRVLRDEPANLTPKTAICRKTKRSNRRHRLGRTSSVGNRLRSVVQSAHYWRRRIMRRFSRRVVWSSGFTRTRRVPW